MTHPAAAFSILVVLGRHVEPPCSAERRLPTLKQNIRISRARHEPPVGGLQCTDGLRPRFHQRPLFADAGRQRLSPIKLSPVDEGDISAGVANTGKLGLARVPMAAPDMPRKRSDSCDNHRAQLSWFAETQTPSKCDLISEAAMRLCPPSASADPPEEVV